MSRTNPIDGTYFKPEREPDFKVIGTAVQRSDARAT